MTDHFRITIVAPLPEDHRERAQAILDLYGALDTVRRAFDAVTGVAIAIKEEIVPDQPTTPAPKRGRPAKVQTATPSAVTGVPYAPRYGSAGGGADWMDRAAEREAAELSDPGTASPPPAEETAEQPAPASATVVHRGRKAA
ncbi:MAG: hypothetical protein KGL39_30420 [Patescibacteria group bacterium]|nr:hypothetical protein [Patescibacteria group bacterium]